MLFLIKIVNILENSMNSDSDFLSLGPYWDHISRTMRILALIRTVYLKRISTLARVTVPENHENASPGPGYGT
jgi:hypothetical protein